QALGILFDLLAQGGKPRTCCSPLRHRSSLTREFGQELLEHGLGVPDDPHLHATIGADLLRLNVDMNKLGISRELSPEAEHPVEPRSDDHDDISMTHHGTAC